MNNIEYINVSGSLTETAIKTQRTRDMLYLPHKYLRVVLYDNTSLSMQTTLNSDKICNNILNVCHLSNDNIYIHKYIDDAQQIADYIVYYIPETLGDETVNNIFNILNKNMADAGYYIDTEPEYTYNKDNNINEYIIQYEHIFPEYPKLYMPDKLRYITDVDKLCDIKEYGIISNDNLYFSWIYDEIHIIQKVREKSKHIQNIQSIEYIDVTISTPNDIKFYIYNYTAFPRQIITFNNINKEYIISSEIKSVKRINKFCYML